MELLNIIFLLIVAVGVSRILANVLPIPLPIVQIAMGVVVAYPGIGMDLELDPEIFMVLFIPPLLAYDAYSLPRLKLIQNLGPTLGMAFGLVILTVVALGYFINFLIPQMPLAVCFALAAVLSPTDALAVSGIAHGKIPSRIMGRLEAESLFNDASGLSLFRVGLVAAITGVFSIVDAGISIVAMAVGGLVIGAAISFGVGKIKAKMHDKGMTDPATHVVAMLLVPFLSFVVAEHSGFSGILAAVASGFVSARVDMRPKHMQTRMLNKSIWHMTSVLFSGLAFVVLGSQAPKILDSVWDHSLSNFVNTGTLVLDVILITLVIYVIRFLWLYGYKKMVRAANSFKGRPTDFTQDAIVSLLMTVSGIRGAITLAGVLSVPLMLGDGPFPGRDVMIFVSMGVILVSIIVGAVGIPLLMRFVAKDESAIHDKILDDTRRQTAEAAILYLESWEHNHEMASDASEASVMAEVAARIMLDYRQDVDALDSEAEVVERASLMEKLELDLRTRAIEAQRKALKKLRSAKKIDDEILRELMEELDYSEAALR
ncbi:Na+/H+ antiporter [Pseudomonas fluorescens]|uniref:Na+/H+ antiporter n=1 Tax=Pseudomonas TaxID=286 RepID=UPI000F042889|nr:MULTISPECIES: Na+/H+ antiporter [Pseudomonas]MBD8088388.1 Na+/H+ antiporter [Pseudomonas fluorescens]MBD8615166.1 Na+/H+ antiporter [Pseudomonas putida]MBD8681159.1 Na+/H+ antiporter [Pseudomonas sp. CFBP 13719]